MLLRTSTVERALAEKKLPIEPVEKQGKASRLTGKEPRSGKTDTAFQCQRFRKAEPQACEENAT
ncbi:MAG: hypothetical protein ACP5T0_06630 [Verrucomicrobiia bacterium]